ncbi:TIGR00270 family protein [Candidatus Micrarchaeota archaeon]|nr:TIGR00270 family protein [Candidatus Micrarchaeota archaeon]
MANLYCDICGKQPVRAQIQLEGAKLVVCGPCSRSGKILFRFSEDEDKNEEIAQTIQSAPSFDKQGEEVMEEAPQIIKRAREKAGLSLKALGEKIKETESYIHAIENGRMNASIPIAKKLERELKIRIIEMGGKEVTTTISGSKKFSEPTLGDLLEEAQRNKKEKKK